MQTYKYYLPTGERLGIFYKDGTITVIPCSKNDQFSKKEANGLFKKVKSPAVASVRHFSHFVVLNSQVEFLQWCNNNYRRMFNVFTPVKGIIVKVEKIKRKKLNSYNTIKISYLA